jgi:hypothetical protein
MVSYSKLIEQLMYYPATIKLKDKRLCLGTFSDFNKAVSARKSAEEKYYSEFLCS